MNRKIITTLLMITSLSTQTIDWPLEGVSKAIREGSQKIATTIGVVGAAVVGPRVYNWIKTSPEEKAKKTAADLEDCFKTHINSPVNKFEIPSQCTPQLLAFLNAREAVDNPEKIKKASDIIKAYKELRDL